MNSASAPWGRRQWVLLGVLLPLVATLVDWRQPAGSLGIVLDQTRFWVEIGILAPFALLVIVTGGIDLSVGSILALSGVTIVRLHAEGGVPMALAAPAGLIVGGAAGAVNGALVVLLGVPDLVVTLVTMAAYRGLAQAVAQNRVYSSLPEGYRFLAEGLLGGIPVPWLVLLGAWAIAYVLIHATRLGRHAFAVGASLSAARVSGVPLGRTRIAVYALSGLAAALAAILFTARSNTARSDDGVGFELEAITCVVLGGAAIAGGRGSAPGVFLGFLLLAAMRTGLTMFGVPEIHQRIALGCVLVVLAALNERLAGT